jgi:hypothetical protein
VPRSARRTIARPKLIERRMSRFLSGPASVRNAAGLIALSTTIVVVCSGILMRVLDHSEYPTVGRGVWWAMQTVTTVGYGDVTPAHTAGRIIAAFVMLWGIASVSIVVAAVTSSFVARAAREHEREEQTEEERIHARFDDLAGRLDRMEQALSGRGRT